MLKKPDFKSFPQDTAINEISAALYKGANPTFRYNLNPNLRRTVARRIVHEINAAENPADCLQICRGLIKDHDYRIALNYLASEKKNEPDVIDKYRALTAEKNRRKQNLLRYELSVASFRCAPTKTDGFFISGVAHFSEILTDKNLQTTVYLGDDRLRNSVLKLLADVKNQIGDFIDHQFDLPALNALINQGVVKYWHFPDGTAVVSKRTNPKKPGRLFNELINYEKITARINDNIRLTASTDSKIDFSLKITPPFAVVFDSSSGFYYALSKYIAGPTLEDILLNEHGQTSREIYIRHYRQILDILFDNGIIWGDMTPRNIIVERSGKQINYNLVDFEKTSVPARTINLKSRKEQCRGQIFAEELCMVCSPAEVGKYFSDYFNPDEWELNSEQKPDFQPRPEVDSIIRGRRLQNVTLGTYNRIDKEMLDARIPDDNAINKFPGHLNFKVEHYLSSADYPDASDYERKTTEILIFAKKNDCFESTVSLLTKITDAAEGAFVLSEFSNILKGHAVNRTPVPRAEVTRLAESVDKLYEARNDKSAFVRFSFEMLVQKNT